MPTIELTEGGMVCGEATYHHISDSYQLEVRHITRENSDFFAYLEYVNLLELYPITYLVNIEIKPDLRRGRKGSKLLSMVEQIAIENKSKFLVCKIGHFDTDEEEQRNNNFYMSNGWMISEPDTDVTALAFKKTSSYS